MVRGFARYAIGREAFETTRIWVTIWAAANPTGHRGVTISALAAIDVACWASIAAKTDYCRPSPAIWRSSDG
jgi:L-alanine-DL-glutamate epimerase-like enolase superfamily enzyme